MVKQNVALFGVSANPITLGHELAARAVYAQCMDIDQVWFSPCHKHQFDKEMIDEEQRFRMCHHVVKTMQTVGFDCWEWEITSQFSGTTWDFYKRTQEKEFCPEINFHFVIGADNAQTIKEKWDHGKELIEKMPFIVIRRGGEKVMLGGRNRSTPWWEKSPHREINFQWPISSTQIRDAIRDGNYRFAKRNLNPEVWNIIRDKELYGYKP